LSIKALETSDLPLIMSSVLFISVIFIAINFFVDYLYEWLDPRVSRS
jgi:peptide/nickel transport system permease protein